MNSVKSISVLASVTLVLCLTSFLALAKKTAATTTTTATPSAQTTTTVAQSTSTTETPTSVTTTTTTTTENVTTPIKGRKESINVGAMALGYYEYSTSESLYVDFTADHIAATGLGGKGFFEYGVTDSLAVEGALSFSYILDANFNTDLMSRSFWGLDALGVYYFTAYNKTIQPYVAFGGGILFSDRGLAPVLDLGGGAHFKFTDSLSLKAELLGKSGIVHNRAEVGLGVAVHF